MLVHVDNLVFPVDFVVIDMKGDTRGSAIIGQPFLATVNALVDIETDELSLKLNKENVVFNVYEWTLYVEDMKTCYRLEEKGTKVDKGENEVGLIDMRVSLAPDMP